MADNIRNTINDLIEDMKIKQQQREEKGYDERIGTLLDDLYTDATEGFKYEPEADPEYQAMIKDYNIEADRTMRDVLAQGAARTGGIASTAAIAAASQARDYQMSGLADAKAKHYNNALAKNEAEVSAKYQILQALENLEDDERNDYLSLLSMRESVDSNNRDDARTQIQNLLLLGMTPGDDLIAASGWDKEYVTALGNSAADSMGNAQLQQYLNSMGADLGVDGVWGPRSEAAYQKVFGRPSGRQQSTGSTYTPGYTPTENNPGYTPSSNPSKNPSNPTNSYVSFNAVAKDIESINSKTERGKAINELYSEGLISSETRNNLMTKYTR